MAAILSPAVGMGGGDLLIRNTAREKEVFAECWGNLLFVTLATGAVLVTAVMAIARFVLPQSISSLVIVAVVLADLVFVKLLDSAAYGFQALERLELTAVLNITLSLARLLGITVLTLMFHHPTAQQWSVVYLAATILVALWAIVWLYLRVGRPRLAFSRIRRELVEGLYFAIGQSAQTIYNDIDKSMLARMANLDATGIYAAAYRLVEVAFVPVRSLLTAAYPGFFRVGEQGLRATVARMKRLVTKPCVYALAAFFGALVFAPVIPHVLGSGYARAVEALRWLAILPLLKTLHYFLADSLSGAGYQGLRTLIQIVVALFNLGINIWLIPAYSWRGAAWSSIASDALLALGMWVLILSLQTRSTPASCPAGQ
jgi:O-antigen/teichoic acid export membrane protein